MKEETKMNIFSISFIAFFSIIGILIVKLIAYIIPQITNVLPNYLEMLLLFLAVFVLFLLEIGLAIGIFVCLLFVVDNIKNN